MKQRLIKAALALEDRVGRLTKQKTAPNPLPHPKHICLIILHQIGDMIMCLPTIAGVRAAFPNAQLTIIAGNAPSQLIQANDWNAEVITFSAVWQHVVRHFTGDTKNKAATSEALADFAALLAKLNPDVALVFHPDVRVNRVLAQSAIPVTIGFTNDGGSYGLTHGFPVPTTGHQVERNYALLETLAKACGVKIAPVAPPSLKIPTDVQKNVDSRLQADNLLGKPVVVLHPFASAPPKAWLPERWAEISQWCVEQGYHPVIIGGPKDTIDLPAALAEKVATYPGTFSLMEIGALLTHAKLFIGIDSGPGHIAAAVGCHVISIFSSVNVAQRWHPYGKKEQTIILHKPVADRKRYPLEVGTLPPGTQSNPYTDQISVADVTAAAEKLLSR